jgi:serine/threonine protein kinase
MNHNGGKVINSGGFGCIFLPEVICKNKNSKNSKTRKITKMMLNRHASDEYNQIMKIKQIVNKIPNYGNYFVIKNIEMCKIKKLSDEDLNQYQEKCSALQKYNITKKNIRKSFKKISIVNIPYAGMSLDLYIGQNFTIPKMIHLNKLLIDLLQNAIVPMNNLGVYHSDVKSSNILISDSHKKVRFIDWGLTVVHPKKYFSDIPSKWKNRPFQFNVPFEIILFTDDFVSKMDSFIESYQEQSIKNKHNAMFEFINDYIYYWLNERGKGHLNYIHNIFIMLGIIDDENIFNPLSESKQKHKSQFEKYSKTITFITNYIVFILVKYTEFDDNGSFSLINYLNTKFKNYTDIWGFLISYIPIIEVLHENISSLESSHKILFHSLKRIIITYLYNPKVELLNVTNIVKDLKKINFSLKQFSKNETPQTNQNSHIISSLTETPITII